MPVNFFAFFQFIVGAAIRTDGFSGFDDFNIDAWMHVPERRIWPGAVKRQVFGFDKNGLIFWYGWFWGAAHGVS